MSRENTFIKVGKYVTYITALSVNPVSSLFGLSTKAVQDITPDAKGEPLADYMRMAGMAGVTIDFFATMLSGDVASWDGLGRTLLDVGEFAALTGDLYRYSKSYDPLVEPFQKMASYLKAIW